MLFMVARSDGYIASSFPLLDVMSVCMDFPVSLRMVSWPSVYGLLLLKSRRRYHESCPTLSL